MDEAQFSQWQILLEHRTGMTLPAERRSFLETNLAIRMREIGCSSYQAYYETIVLGPDAFRLVSVYVLTRLREQFRNHALEAGRVGGSTGEEPYPLAMVLGE